MDATCGHFEDGWGVCGAPAVGLYLTGWCCAAHTPAAMAGRPENRPDPARTLAGLRKAAGAPDAAPPPPMSASRVMDDRAIASGKRRSSPAAYRESQARVEAAKTAPVDRRRFPASVCVPCIHCRKPVAPVNRDLYGADEHAVCHPIPERPGRVVYRDEAAA